MAEQEIYHSFRSHWDNDGDRWKEGGNGDDAHNFSVPAGKRFSRYSLQIDANTMGSFASAEDVPDTGATGNQSMKVSWTFFPFGKIAYTLRLYADDGQAAPLEVWVGSAGYLQTALEGIKQNIEVQLVLGGPDAVALGNIFRSTKGMGPLPPTGTAWKTSLSGAHDAALAKFILGAGVATAFSGVCMLVIYAIARGYDVTEISFTWHAASPGDDRLRIHLVPGSD